MRTTAVNWSTIVFILNTSPGILRIYFWGKLYYDFCSRCQLKSRGIMSVFCVVDHVFSSIHSILAATNCSNQSLIMIWQPNNSFAKVWYTFWLQKGVASIWKLFNSLLFQIFVLTKPVPHPFKMTGFLNSRYSIVLL